ncbi:hypothetical protein GS421_13560 [Rhodococcus hoagii]|nr:hypothetical protein [Prescottella equi]
MTTAGAERKGPLTGISVVEFAGIGPGPHAATLLADWAPTWCGSARGGDAAGGGQGG